MKVAKGVSIKSQAKSIRRALRDLASLDIERTAERRGLLPSTLLGVSTEDIRKLAKCHTADKGLAEELFASHYHEEKLLAVLLYPKKQITITQLNRWVKKIASWDLCDHFCKTLALHASDLTALIGNWVRSPALYTKRAGLALIANHCMRQHDLTEAQVEFYVQCIIETSNDDRQHVKQACCWALRKLGKVDDSCHEQAIAVALDLVESSHPAAVWVGKCAYRELETLVKAPERRRLLSSKSKTGSKQRKPKRK